MDVLYILVGVILMACTGYLMWINWRILRVSEELLIVSKVLLDETIQVRKKLTARTKKAIIPIVGSKTK